MREIMHNNAWVPTGMKKKYIKKKRLNNRHRSWGWQLDTFLNSRSPMSHDCYSWHQWSEISTVVCNTIWGGKKKNTHSQRAIWFSFSPLRHGYFFLKWSNFIHSSQHGNSMASTTKFLIIDAPYTRLERPAFYCWFSLWNVKNCCQKGLFGFIWSFMNHFTELCLIHKSMTPAKTDTHTHTHVTELN